MSSPAVIRPGCRIEPIDLSAHLAWPLRVPPGEAWAKVLARTQKYPVGRITPRGLPFDLRRRGQRRAIYLQKGAPAVTLTLRRKASHLCFLHEWAQLSTTPPEVAPREGSVVGEYILHYADGSAYRRTIRSRFEVWMAESPGPAWLALPLNSFESIDPARPTAELAWGQLQYGARETSHLPWPPLVMYALVNPHPQRTIASLELRGRDESPLLVFALSLYTGAAHPLRHLPRRAYQVRAKRHGRPLAVAKASVDLGVVTHVEHTRGPRGQAWLDAPYRGLNTATEPELGAEDIVHIAAAPDATLTLELKDRKASVDLSVGDAFRTGRSSAGGVELAVLGRQRQWMQVTVIDESTGKPTPVRIHFSGSRGEYIAPHGHHEQVNANWFEDYGADVTVGGRTFAYVHGTFTTEFPVGDLYVEISKGFEYEPVRRHVRVTPGQKELRLSIRRWADLRHQGWVTADTHVHFISPHTAWLEAQAEGVNVVNLLASQWGRLFTNVGDILGRPNIVENDTIVYVGTENRNHMLGHMSMLGTKGLPVYPMCCGGMTEAWIGDPDFRTLAEWALENRRKGGVVIRPHFPWCGGTEDPVPILAGLVDAIETWAPAGGSFQIQEWYRYLNCGYRVAVVGGTDKMGAYCSLGWARTYAKLDSGRPLTYDLWGRAVRAGRTVATTGPLLDLTVDGHAIGEQIGMPAGGGTVEVEAVAQSAWPLGVLEIVANGHVVAQRTAPQGARRLTLRQRVPMKTSGWIAARCAGPVGHPAAGTCAHTSPVYVRCGHSRAFDAPAAEHMLSLVQGGIEYLNTLATVFDETTRRRMVKLFQEARQTLKGRLLVETHRHAGGQHTHAH